MLNDGNTPPTVLITNRSFYLQRSVAHTGNELNGTSLAPWQEHKSGDLATNVRARRRQGLRPIEGRFVMLSYAITFLVLAIIAGLLGASGVAAMATNFAYILFVIALVLFLINLVSGRRTLAP